MSSELTVYTRAACSLCEAMVEELAALRQEYGFALLLIDVDGDPDLAQRYGAEVPVLVTPAGETLCRYFLDPAEVRRYFAKP